MPASPKKVLGLLLPALLLWALFFVGWGLDDLAGFFAHPARAGLVGVALVGVVLLLLWRPDIELFRKGKLPVSPQRWGLAALMGIAIVLAALIPYGDRRGVLVFADSDALRYTGLAVHIVGVALRLAGVRALDKQFSGYVTLQENHQLVQSGVYRLIRHPLYLGGLLGWVGLLLVFCSWLVFPVSALALVFIWVRIQEEEKLLAEHFGSEFEAYRRRTWRLIPYLY